MPSKIDDPILKRLRQSFDCTLGQRGTGGHNVPRADSYHHRRLHRHNYFATTVPLFILDGITKANDNMRLNRE
jgi:hypothetical protein